MRRLAFGLVVGVAIFGGVYGLAASLGVSAKSLGAGNTAVAACQAATLTASYATAYDSTIPGYKVGIVTVSGLDTVSPTNCANKAFKVSLTGAANASLAEVTGVTPGGGNTFPADFTTNGVPAANVTGIHVLITG